MRPRTLLLPLALSLLSTAATATAAPAAPAPAAPEKIVIGIYLNQIYNIDLKANQFGVDFWIWFRWSGEGAPPHETFEIVGGRVQSKTNLLKKTLSDGVHYDAVRVNAIVSQQWDLSQFPFDDHRITIKIEDAERETARALFVPDVANQGVDPDVSVAGWRVAGFGHTVEDHVYRSNYGDTSAASGAETHYARYGFQVDLKRVGSGRFFKIFFGLFVATLVSWCGFFIRPKDSSPRVSVSVGALFAASAVTLAINSQLPDVSYVTLADKMVFLSLAMILLSLFGTVTSLTLHYLGKEQQHRLLDRVAALLFPIAYIVGLIMVVR